MGKPKPIDERIAAAKVAREKLDLRLNQLQAKERTQKRKSDTRRKIVVGAAILAHMERDPMFARMAARQLDKIVTRPQDRALIADLLDLPPLPVPAAAHPAPPPQIARAANEAGRPIVRTTAADEDMGSGRSQAV